MASIMYMLYSTFMSLCRCLNVFSSYYSMGNLLVKSSQQMHSQMPLYVAQTVFLSFSDHFVL